MKAVICTGYGAPEVLKLKEVLKPVPKENELLIKIHATSITASDIFIRGSKIPLYFLIPMRLMLGIIRPRQPILGLVLAGVVESAGKNVKRFKKGDELYGFTGFKFGSYAEYICLPETDSKLGCLSLKPANISFEEAAAVPYGGILASHFLKLGNIQKGQKVLIYGSSGAIGTTAVQLAKYYGANVTGICGTSNLEMVKNLGADKVVDYMKEETTPPGEKYDFIFDAVGTKKTSKLKINCKKALSANGIYVTVDTGSPKSKSEYLDFIRELIEKGSFKPVIDKVYPLDRVIEAHRYVEKGHKKGNVVIKII